MEQFLDKQTAIHNCLDVLGVTDKKYVGDEEHFLSVEDRLSLLWLDYRLHGFAVGYFQPFELKKEHFPRTFIHEMNLAHSEDNVYLNHSHPPSFKVLKGDAPAGYSCLGTVGQVLFTIGC